MNILTESKITDLFNRVAANDKIVIKYGKSNEMEFTVNDAISGQIKMVVNGGGVLSKNIFFTAPSYYLNGELSTKYINTNKLKDGEDISKPATWVGKYTFKNITNIEIIRNGNVVDKIDPIERPDINTSKPISDEYRDFVNDILLMLNSAAVNDTFSIETASGISSKLTKMSDNQFSLLSSDSSIEKILFIDIKIPDSDDYEGDLIDLNNKIVVITSPKTFSLIFTDDARKKFVIKDISSIVKKGSSDEVAPEEVDDKKPKSTDSSDNDILDKNDILDIIMGNPVIKKAFYHQPKLMGLINLGDPVGLIAANKLLNNVNNNNNNKEIDKNIYNRFRDHTSTKFTVLSDMSVTFNDGDTMVLNRSDVYLGTVRRGGGGVKILYPRERVPNRIGIYIVDVNVDNSLDVKYGVVNPSGDVTERKSAIIKIIEYNVDSLNTF